MALAEGQINTIGMLLTTWHGFHKVRRRHGLYISHCYVLLAFVWIEGLGRSISEGSVQRLLTMLGSSKLHYLFVFLLERQYIVLARFDGRRRYYSLTDEGRRLALLLIEGVENSQIAFFNKYLK